MKKIAFSLTLLLVVITIFYHTSDRAVLNSPDYEQYLTAVHFEKQQSELRDQINFWEKKLQAQLNNAVYQQKLAGLYTTQFRLSGDIGSIHRSDSLLQLLHDRFPGNVSVLQSLSTNAVTRHAFLEAESFIRKAYHLGEDKFASALLLTDIFLERGKLAEAGAELQNIDATTHFDYLVRAVKAQDQQGNLGEAIASMEQAAAIARSSGNRPLTNWALSNLADLYGHDGQIRRSYQGYLQALSYNPADFHSLKGIAWIAFSHDKDTKEARRILTFLKSVHQVPDYDLLLAELAAFEENKPLEEQHLQQFADQAARSVYGNMYKRYLCLYLSDHQKDLDKALQIAEEEIEERPHPLSYDLLAWVYFQSGDTRKALQIMNDHVLGRSEEPVILYHAGIILKDTGNDQDAKPYLLAAREAAFELGPLAMKELEE